MSIIRSVTTRLSSNANVEYRIGLHQPMKPGEDGVMAPSGDPYPVIELYQRNESGEWWRVTSFHVSDFIDLNRDVLRISREMLAPFENADSSEDSVEVRNDLKGVELSGAEVS